MNPDAIVVLDANFSWTRDLFLPLRDRARLLFVQPRSWRAPPPSPLPPGVDQWAPRYPPGWFLRWPAPFQRALARRIRKWWPEGHRRVAVFSYPNYWPAARHAGADLRVYYWSDEFRAYWGADQDPRLQRRITKMEREAVRGADLTVTASRTKALRLQAEVPEARERIRFLVHGHHASLDSPLPPAATELADAPRPIIGHWGQVSKHLDLETALAVARAFPQGTLAFVGPVNEDFEEANVERWSALRSLPNVRFVRSQPYARIGEFLAAFDVAICLYRPGQLFTDVTNPSKIRDYLAAGRPVVSTDVPDAKHFWSGLVHVAATPEDAVRATRAALQEGPKAAVERRAYASDHTWPKVSQRLTKLIQGDVKDGFE